VVLWVVDDRDEAVAAPGKGAPGHASANAKFLIRKGEAAPDADLSEATTGPMFR